MINGVTQRFRSTDHSDPVTSPVDVGKGR